MNDELVRLLEHYDNPIDEGARIAALRGLEDYWRSHSDDADVQQAMYQRGLRLDMSRRLESDFTTEVRSDDA